MPIMGPVITPSSSELLTIFPELATYGLTATRLHPRPGIVSAAESHIGGPLRWPADEAWPTCVTPCMVKEEVPIPVELVDRLHAAEARRTQRHIMVEG